MDETLSCYHNVVVRQHDIDTVKDGQWLNDTMIEFYFEYLDHEVVPKDASILLLRPGIAHLITYSADDPQQLVPVLPPQLHQYEAIFAPINDGDPSVPYSGSHWSLLVFIRSACTFYYFDTMGDCNLQDAKQFARRITPLLAMDRPVELIPMTTPQQTNGADCGAWVIAITDYQVQRLISASPSKSSTASLIEIDEDKLKSSTDTRMKLEALVAKLCQSRS